MQTVTVRGRKYKVNIPSAHSPFGVARFGRNKIIVGITPMEDYDPELFTEFQDAWSSRITCTEIKTYKVPSLSHFGHMHTVRRFGDNYSCNCPATVECRHIKWVKRKEAVNWGPL